MAIRRPLFTGRATVPVLWDKETHTIVNNESADIIRMFNREFDDITQEFTDYYPEALAAEIDQSDDLWLTALEIHPRHVGFQHALLWLDLPATSQVLEIDDARLRAGQLPDVGSGPYRGDCSFTNGNRLTDGELRVDGQPVDPLQWLKKR